MEERGSKFLESWDSAYEPLLETHDPGQAPQKGGLVFAKYGKGVYIYNAYAFYRQMPEGVPGAYRIFANMVSLAKNPQLMSSQPTTTHPGDEVHSLIQLGREWTCLTPDHIHLWSGVLFWIV